MTRRKRSGHPGNVAGAHMGFSHANTITRAIGNTKLCEDCPPKGYPTDKTRCAPCPRRTQLEAMAADLVVAARSAPTDE